MDAHLLNAAQLQYLNAAGIPPESSFFTNQVSVSFGERVDPAPLEAAWEAVIKAFPTLRRGFANGSGKLMDAPSAWDWISIDWSSKAPESLGDEWAALVAQDAKEPIAVSDRAPHRIHMIALPNGAMHGLWSYHSALLDFDSASAVLSLWLVAYDSLRSGGSLPDFSTVASEPGESLVAEASDEAERWKAHFEGAEIGRPLVLFPLPDSAGDLEVRAVVSRTFERADRIVLEAFAQEHGVGVDDLFRAAWVLLMARAGGRDEAVVLEFDPVDGSMPTRSEAIFPVRHRVDGARTVGDLLKAVKCAADGLPVPPEFELSGIAEAAGVSLDRVQPGSAFFARRGTLNDRIQSASPRWMSGDFKLTERIAPPVTALVTLTNRPEAAISFSPTRLSQRAAESLLARWCGLVAQLVEDASAPVKSLSLLLEGEAAEAENQDVPHPFGNLVPQGLHEAFADCAKLAPDRVALELDGHAISLKDVDRRANQIARALRSRGVDSDMRVAVGVGRNADWLPAFLGVLKAGASALLCSPDDLRTGKPSRLVQAKVKAVVAASLPADAPDFSGLIFLDLESAATAIQNEKPRPPQVLCTVTSEAVAWFGSDGKVNAVSHERLLEILSGAAAMFGLEAEHRTLAFSSLASLDAIEEIFSPILSGGTAVMRSNESWPTRTAFQDFVQDSKISALRVPAAFFSQWLHYLSGLSVPLPDSLNVVVVSGGRVLEPSIRAWVDLNSHTALVHEYRAPGLDGVGLAHGIAAGEGIDFPLLPFGRPSPRGAAWIEAFDGSRLPQGFAGRLVMEGPSGMVRTGEAYFTDSGSFVPRDLLEAAMGLGSAANTADCIEAAAVSHPEIFDAVAAIRTCDGAPEPCLWIVPRDADRGEPQDFRSTLAARLPEVLCPRRIGCLPRLPLTASGLLAIAELATPDPEAPPVETEEILSPEEEKLRRILSRALGGRRIGADQMLVDGKQKPAVAKHLNETLAAEGYAVELADFESGFSVRSLARNIRGRAAATDGRWVPLEPVKPSGSRKPIIFVHDGDGGSRPYAPLVAHMDAEIPCYVLVAKGADGSESPHQSLDELMDAYIAALAVFDPEGPYQLAGFDLGGLLAFELGRRISERGKGVASIAVIGTEPPTPADPAKRLTSLSVGLKRSFSKLFGGGHREAESPKSRRLRDSAVFQALTAATKDYKAAQCSVTLHCFIPEGEFVPARDAEKGWLAVCDDSRFYEVPCPRSELLIEPAAEAIAEALSEIAQ